MRFVAVLLFLLAIPLLHEWMRKNVRNQRYVWMAMGFMPFVIGVWHLDASIISWPMWPGYVKGMLFSLLDAMALAVLATIPGRKGGTPFAWLYGGYILAAVVAIGSAEVKLAAFFFAWQLARMLIVMLAVARIATRPDGARYILYGVLAGAVLQTGYSINERLHGNMQAAGAMGHQNLLGMMLHFAVYPALALMLAGRRDKILLIGFAASLLAMMLTGSRGTIGIAAIGVVLVVSISLLRRPTARKFTIAGAGVLSLLIAAPLGYSTISKRFSGDAIESSDEEREAFKRAAWAMIKDYPMGVGGNQYVVVANSNGYSERAGVNWNSSSRSTNVHNSYLLQWAELGLPGILIVILLLAVPCFTGLYFSFKNKRHPQGELILGLSTSIVCVALHSFYEWALVVYPVQYLLSISIGITSGILWAYRQETGKSPGNRRPRRLRPAQSTPMLRDQR